MRDLIASMVRRMRPRPRVVCRNVHGARHPRRALVLYITAPFVHPDLVGRHQNVPQVRALARILDEAGFDVDVIDYDDTTARLDGFYHLVIDLHPGLNPVYRSHMAPGCLTVGYITGSNPAWANRAERERLEALASRRGARLQPRRQSRPFPAEVMAGLDAVWLIGDDRTGQTFEEFALRRLSLLRNTGHEAPSSGESGPRRANTFVFVGSTGQVHKGLDLLLEAIAARPHLELAICGNVRTEADFCRAYRQELFHRPNIHTHGFVDIPGPRFRELAGQAAYLVLPSCSEGIAGGVLAGMSEGLIPLVSPHCGLPAHQSHWLTDLSVEGLGQTLEAFAERHVDWIQSESARARAVIEGEYRMIHYEASVRAALNELLG